MKRRKAVDSGRSTGYSLAWRFCVSQDAEGEILRFAQDDRVFSGGWTLGKPQELSQEWLCHTSDKTRDDKEKNNFKMAA